MESFLDRAQRALSAIRNGFRPDGLKTNGSQGERGSVSGPDGHALSLQIVRAISGGERVPGLPEAFYSAFDAAPLATLDDRFVGRAESLGVIESAIAQWRTGGSAMLAVTAPQGAGISSFLARVPSLLPPGEPVDSRAFAARVCHSEDVLATVASWFDLEQTPASAHALIMQLRAAAPRVILVDDAHYLVNRLAELEAVRVFGSILVATQDRHLWILGCRRHAFARLVYLHQADRFFSHQLELSYFSQEELAEVVRLRLQRAGLSLTDDEDASADVPIGLGEGRLRELYQCSGGKPDLAFAGLLRASRAVGDGSHAQMARPSAVDVSVLQELERPELLALAELIVHGNLSVAEHGGIFRVPRASSALSLSYLHNLGLLDQFGDEGDESAIRYAVVKPIWALVVKHLETANYLY